MDEKKRREKRLQNIREKRKTKMEPVDIQQEALYKFKSDILVGLTDYIGTGSAILDILIKDRTKMFFYILGEFLEDVSTQILDDSLDTLNLKTYRDEMTLAKITQAQDLPERIQIPKAEISPVLPLLKEFFKNNVSNFLNVYHEFY